MLLKREGWPEEGEFVLCSVTKVMPTSVFCNLVEYDKQGMIHISEIAPGRIRNIRDYVIEGKFVVCKVLKVDKNKGHIDLSLRRVSEVIKNKKMNEIKMEQRAEKIVENVAKTLGMDVASLYSIISKKIFEKYPMLYVAFEDVAFNNKSLIELGIEKNIAKKLEETIKQKIKPPEVTISGKIKASSTLPNGVEIIKNALTPLEREEGVIIKYIGNGTFLFKVSSTDYKSAEKKLKVLIDRSTEYMKKNNSILEFARSESS